ncbi:uncharacterized protein LOC108923574 isoform X1 [Arapaima gigas]
MDAGRTLDLWLCVAAVLCLPCRSQGPSRVPEVRARLGGVAELECGALLPFDPAPAGPAPPLVVEWLRKGYSIPVLIQFGVHAPRAHPDYEVLSSTAAQVVNRWRGIGVSPVGGQRAGEGQTRERGAFLEAGRACCR